MKDLCVSNRFYLAILLILIVALEAATFPVKAAPATFNVTVKDDPHPDGCQVNDCSLREAIIAANGNGNPDETDTINIPVVMVARRKPTRSH